MLFFSMISPAEMYVTDRTKQGHQLKLKRLEISQISPYSGQLQPRPGLVMTSMGPPGQLSPSWMSSVDAYETFSTSYNFFRGGPWTHTQGTLEMFLALCSRSVLTFLNIRSYVELEIGPVSVTCKSSALLSLQPNNCISK